jgi:nucleotide-binding universal stress UspA family protein
MHSSTSFVHFKSILCGVDFSRHSASALRYAAALARGNGASLTVVYALDPLLNTATATTYFGRSMVTSARADLQRFIRRTLGRQLSASARIVVGVGKAPQLVLEAAERCAADVVVVGTHGLTGLKKAFFGSTTQAILRRSPLPVLAVPYARRSPGRFVAGTGEQTMLVLTLPPSGPIGRFVEATEAYRFVRQASCPVLVLRLKGGPEKRRKRTASRLRPVA